MTTANTAAAIASNTQASVVMDPANGPAGSNIGGGHPSSISARPQLRRLLRRVGDCVKDAGEGFDLHVVGVHCPAFQTFGRRADYSNSSEWVDRKSTRLN